MSRRILRLALVVALVHVCSLNRVALADPLQELEAVKTQLKTPVEVVTKAESDATKVKQEFDQPKTALHDAVKQHAQGATTAVKDAERLLKRLTRAAEEAQDLQDQSEETVNRLRMEIAKEKDPAKRPPLETKHSGAVTALAKATTTNLILKQGLEDAMAQLKTMKEQLKKINTASKDVAAGMKPIDPMDNAASAAIVKAALPDLVKLVVPKLLEEIKQGSLKADPATPGAGLPPAPAPGPVVAAKTPRVHGLVLVTGEPTLRQNALQSVIQLKTCLEQAQRQTPNLFRSVTSLGANEPAPFRMTSQMIRDYVERSLSVKNQFEPDDTIVCYVLQHGGYHTTINGVNVNNEAHEYGHFFQLEDGSHFSRCDLFELLLDQRRKVGGTNNDQDRLRGLTVLISDSCNVGVDRGDVGAFVFAFRSPLFVALLTKYEGQVSINSSSTGELAWYNRENGGRFTAALFDQLNALSETTSWPALIEAVEEQLRLDFPQNGKRYGGVTYTAQTPKWMRSETRVRLRQ